MLDYNECPVSVRSSLRQYIEDGCEIGGFLRAVLSNDLFGAISRADSENRKNIVRTVSWIYNNAPRACWGSPEAVYEWLAGGWRKSES